MRTILFEGNGGDIMAVVEENHKFRMYNNAEKLDSMEVFHAVRNHFENADLEEISTAIFLELAANCEVIVENDNGDIKVYEENCGAAGKRAVEVLEMMFF